MVRFPDVDRRTLFALAPGDVAAICVFVALGEYQHFGVTPWTLPRHYALVAGSFLVGWAIAAPLLGAYGRRVRDGWPALVVPLASWAVADVVGVALRATETVPGSASPQFYLVAALFGGLLVDGWRAAALVLRRLS